MATQDAAGSGSTPDAELAVTSPEGEKYTPAALAAARVNAPTGFSLGEAPDPAEFPDPVKKPRKTGSVTHTGTDPHGRAIGPAEDHIKAKRDYDGKTAAQAAGEDEQ